MSEFKEARLGSPCRRHEQAILTQITGMGAKRWLGVLPASNARAGTALFATRFHSGGPRAWAGGKGEGQGRLPLANWDCGRMGSLQSGHRRAGGGVRVGASSGGSSSR